MFKVMVKEEFKIPVDVCLTSSVHLNLVGMVIHHCEPFHQANGLLHYFQGHDNNKGCCNQSVVFTFRLYLLNC